MGTARASMIQIQPSGIIRKNTLAASSSIHASNVQPKTSIALNMGQSQYTDGEPIVHISTINIAEEEGIEMDRADACRSISESVIEESHPECKFCDYCFKTMGDKREVI